jgi:hypothetical protein
VSRNKSEWSVVGRSERPAVNKPGREAGITMEESSELQRTIQLNDSHGSGIHTCSVSHFRRSCPSHLQPRPHGRGYLQSVLRASKSIEISPCAFIDKSHVSGRGMMMFRNRWKAWLTGAGAVVVWLIVLLGRDFAGSSEGPVSAHDDAIWISKKELMALPASGSGWKTLLAGARQSVDSPSLANPNDQTDTITLAKALVGVRTGNQSMIDDARAAIMAAIGTEAGGDSIGIARNLNSFVIAADLVGLDATQDAKFRNWLIYATRTEVYKDGRTMVQMNEERPNNWGLMAGATRATVARYLKDKNDLARVAQVFKGWLGDRTSYAGFRYGGPEKDLSWQIDPAAPVGILPKGAVRDGHNLDGALPEEMRRGDSYNPGVWPPVPTGYCWEALQGAFVLAEVLYRSGYPAYEWQDRALLRAVQFLYGLGRDWAAVGDDAWQVFIINRRYGTNYVQDPAVAHDWYRSQGKVMAWTPWTHSTLQSGVAGIR